MLNSKYNPTSELAPEEDLKKKLLKNKPLEPDAPSVDEISAEVEGNRPAYTKEQVDARNAYGDKKASEITGGNYGLTGEGAPIKKSILNEDGERTTGTKIADGALAGASGIMDMASNVIMNKDDMNRKERTANTLNMTAKGASTGASIGSAVGGPLGGLIGAGAGALAGLTTGIIQGAGDQKRIDTKERLERVAYLDDTKDKRRKAQMLSEGKLELDKSKNMLKSQMGMLGSNYTT